MEQLKAINFNEEDLRLILEALQNLPDKYDMSMLLSEMLTGVVCNNENDKKELEVKLAEKKADIKARKEELKLKSIMVQAKILMLKELLINKSERK